MPDWLSVVLEIIKVTLPALIVFLTVYFLQKSYYENKYRLQLEELRTQRLSVTLPMRLQAYERMMMFCERITLPKLILRIRTESMKSDDLHVSLLVAIEQEFDHNVSQQVYLSSKLWEIITMAKNEALNIVNHMAKESANNSDGLDFSRAVFNYLDENPQQGVRQAKLAISKEVHTLI